MTGKVGKACRERRTAQRALLRRMLDPLLEQEGSERASGRRGGQEEVAAPRIGDGGSALVCPSRAPTSGARAFSDTAPYCSASAGGLLPSADLTDASGMGIGSGDAWRTFEPVGLR